MEVRLFGELEALDGGVPVPVRGAKQLALLALLALQRGRPVSADRLIDLLWGDGQAANPANALQAQIGQLRRTLGPAAILTTEAGYALAAGPGEVDVVRFEQLVAKGQRLAADDEMAPASAALGEALRLRRGEPLAEFTHAGFLDAERAHLDELTLVAIESRAGADLGLGRHGELAGELEALCREHPLRERLCELLKWSSSTTRNFAASRQGSRCTVPPWPWPGAMCPAPCGTPGGRSVFRLLTTTSAVLRQRDSWGSRPGRAGTSRQGTRRMPSAWRDYGGPGTSPIPSGARSRWRIYGVRKVASVRRCAPTSRHCSVHLSRAGRFCGARPTRT